MTKPNWRTAEQFPEFGETFFAEDDYGRYVVLTAIEGEEDDWPPSYVDENENLVDDIEIVRWVPVKEILGGGVRL